MWQGRGLNPRQPYSRGCCFQLISPIDEVSALIMAVRSPRCFKVFLLQNGHFSMSGFENTLSLSVVGLVSVNAVTHVAWVLTGCHAAFCAGAQGACQWPLMHGGDGHGLMGRYAALPSPLRVLSAFSPTSYAIGLQQFTGYFCVS